MRITDVTAYPIAGDRRPYLVVAVDTDEGVYGVGEAGLSGHEETQAAAVRQLREVLVGEDPFRTERLWQRMWRSFFFPARGVMSAAIAAIDIALWDIKGKALGQPVHNLLGGRVRDEVACYTHLRGGFSTTDEKESSAVAAAREAVAEGWRYLRFGVSGVDDLLEPTQAAREAAALSAALREAVGPDIELMIDVHTRLGLPEATWLCDAMAEHRPYFIEDPLRSEYVEGYRQLRRATRVPIAAGEQFDSKWTFRPLIEEDLIDYARIDLCNVGGITESVKVAAMCETHDIRVAVHNPLGPVNTAACLQFNLALTPFGVQEQPYIPGVDAEIFPTQAFSWRAGALVAEDVPGLGIEFDREAAVARRFEGSATLPTLRRADGSFTNW